MRRYLNVYMESGYDFYNETYEYVCIDASEKLTTLQEVKTCLKDFKAKYPKYKGYIIELSHYEGIID